MKRDEPKDYFVHESSFVDDGVKIGRGTSIWHYCHVMAGAQIGEFCVLGQNVFVGGNVIIGNNVKIQNNVSVYDGVILEDDVFCGPSVVFTNVINPRSSYPKDRRMQFLKTIVKQGASLGANATLLCGITIGTQAFIGAGAVVTEDVPDYALVFGNPASLKGWMCECGTRLHFSPTAEGETARCRNCQRQYSKQDEVVTEMAKE